MFEWLKNHVARQQPHQQPHQQPLCAGRDPANSAEDFSSVRIDAVGMFDLSLDGSDGTGDSDDEWVYLIRSAQLPAHLGVGEPRDREPGGGGGHVVVHQHRHLYYSCPGTLSGTSSAILQSPPAPLAAPEIPKLAHQTQRMQPVGEPTSLATGGRPAASPSSADACFVYVACPAAVCALAGGVPLLSSEAEEGAGGGGGRLRRSLSEPTQILSARDDVGNELLLAGIPKPAPTLSKFHAPSVSSKSTAAAAAAAAAAACQYYRHSFNSEHGSSSLCKYASAAADTVNCGSSELARLSCRELKIENPAHCGGALLKYTPEQIFLYSILVLSLSRQGCSASRCSLEGQKLTARGVFGCQAGALVSGQEEEEVVVVVEKGAHTPRMFLDYSMFPPHIPSSPSYHRLRHLRLARTRWHS